MKHIYRIFLILFAFLFFYFFIQGFFSQPMEGDSLAYHLPIAQNILAAKFTNYENPGNLVTSLLQYYPASSHVILAWFVVLGIPNVFNVIGLLVLFFCVRQLGIVLGLNKESTTVAAVVVCTLTSISRLVFTQTMDIWLGVFYTATLVLFLNPKKEKNYFLFLGCMIGMLIGTKFTGPMYILGIVLFFGWQLKKYMTTRFFLVTLISAAMLGLPWYIRNFLSRGDILYPASHPLFHLDEWYTWQTVFASVSSLFYFIQSLLSEYLIWAVVLCAIPFYFAWQLWKYGDILLTTPNKLLFLALFNFGVHLLTPASPNNVLSDLRYTLPTFIVLVPAVFLLAQEWKKSEELSLIAFIPTLSVFSLTVAHRPKIFVLFSMLLVVMLIYKRRNA